MRKFSKKKNKGGGKSPLINRSKDYPSGESGSDEIEKVEKLSPFITGFSGNHGHLNGQYSLGKHMTLLTLS